MPNTYGKLIRDGVNYSHDTADSISYNNNTSGLTSTNTQDAIDEIKTDIDDKVNKSGDTMTGQLVGFNGGGSYVVSRDNASLKNPTVANSSTYYPVVDIKTYIGDWSIGSLGNGGEWLYFVHNLDDNYTNNNNKARKYRLFGATDTADNNTYTVPYLTSVTDGQVVTVDGTVGGIKASGYTIAKSVPSNALFTDTDTKVTSSANHYSPTSVSGGNVTASASGGTAAWSIDVVQGVTLNTDGKGHVTGMSVTSGKIPANPNTDTKVTSSANHYAPTSVSGGDVSAAASGGTAAWSIDVVQGITLNTDGKGHVTGMSVTSGKIPANPNTDVNVKVNNTNPTSGTWYYPTWYTAVSGTGNVNANDGLRYYSLQGTSAAAGRALLSVGNATATGTAGNKYGEIWIYAEKAGYVALKATAGATAAQTITFPNATGTVALTSDVTARVAKAGDTMTGNLTMRMDSEKTASSDPDTPAQIALQTRWTDQTAAEPAQKTSTSYIRAYSDHAGAGNNIVISPGGNLFIGSGESPNSHYNLYKNSSSENTFITADSWIHIQAGANTLANRKGLAVSTSGDVIPDVADVATNNVGSIGTSAYKWANGYFTNINGVAVGDSPKFTDTTYTGTGLISINSSNVISTTAEVNQNAFSNIKVGSTTVAADTKTDTVEYAASGILTITGDATNDKITFGVSTGTTSATAAAGNHTHSAATTAAAGLMSAADKIKLNGIATGAEVNQNAFSNIVVGTTTVAADTKTDTVEFAASGILTITPDATNDKITFGVSTGTTSATAAKGNHTHTLTLAADTGTSTVSLAANSKYKLTAGGSSVIFTTPPNASDDYVSKTNGGTFNGNITISLTNTSTTSKDSYLYLGNATSSGTAGCSRGVLRLYSAGTTYGNIYFKNIPDTDVALYVPTKSGTIATTGDDISQFNNDAGYVTANNYVLQQNQTGSNDYRVLFSYGATSGNQTNRAYKSDNLTFNPSTKDLSIGTAHVKSMGAQIAYFEASDETDKNGSLTFGVYGSGWTFGPLKKDGVTLGSATYRWNQIFSVYTSISTSDRNLKKNITDLDDEFSKKFIMDLKPVSYMFNKPTSDRYHYGLIAQDVEDTLAKFGKTSIDFGGLCKDVKTVPKTIEHEVEYTDEDGNIKTKIETDLKYEEVEGEYEYALRYEEFIAPLIKTVQLQQEEINSCKATISTLTDKVDRLEKLVEQLLNK